MVPARNSLVENPRRAWRPNYSFDAARPSHRAELFPGSQRVGWISLGGQTTRLLSRCVRSERYAQPAVIRTGRSNLPQQCIYHYVDLSHGQLQMYTSHPAQPKSPGGSPEYHMTRLRFFAMTDTADNCRDGLRAYRNGREWCKDKRDNAIKRVNERAKCSASSNGTTEQSETWSWTNGKFQCHKGQDLTMKEQNDSPADVWIYFDEGWPGQGGKKWRLWILATGEILFA